MHKSALLSHPASAVVPLHPRESFPTHAARSRGCVFHSCRALFIGCWLLPWNTFAQTNSVAPSPAPVPALQKAEPKGQQKPTFRTTTAAPHSGKSVAPNASSSPPPFRVGLPWLNGEAVLPLLDPNPGEVVRRLSVPVPSIVRPPMMTLEQAYDRALISDQAIRLAYVAIRKHSLQPLFALTRMEPRVVGLLGRLSEQNDRTGSGSEKESVLSEGFSSNTRNGVNSKQQPQTRTEFGTSTESSQTERVLPRDFFERSTHGNKAAVVLEQPLLDMTVFPAWKLGKLAAQASELECRHVVREVLFGVARAYYAVLKSEGVATVDEETVQLTLNQVRDAKARFEAGESLRTDLLRAEGDLEAARRKAIESRAATLVHRNALNNILNVDRDTAYRVADPGGTIPTPGNLADALGCAFRQREDYKVSALRTAQQEQRLRGAKAAFAPRIVAQLRAETVNEDGSTRETERGLRNERSLSNSSGTTVTTVNAVTDPASGISRSTYADGRERFATSSRTSYSQSHTGWEAVIAVEIPLWGARTLDARAQDLDLTSVELEQERHAKRIEEEVHNAWLAVRTFEQSLIAVRAQVVAAEQNYKDLELQYSAGTATSLETLVALRDLNAARTLLIERGFDLQVARHELQRSTGDFQAGRVQSLRFH